MAAKAEESKSRQPEVHKPGAGSRLTQIRQFMSEVRQEFGKVVWPAKKQTIMSTTVVIALVIVVAIYLGSIDLVLGKLVGAILR
ncbi:preprotein translocase subunit SecE [Desulfurivibrio alkaliphilus]|uniref:Protein translocase subunit SecE n=1 Tax=Desulfurivibrio alkaliphilus (strain DSM 19089 / UNIQEM U267 / AHT2) TaxID=589865 RepID=D6Z3N5_DESAT|nr:preprotein translocase subunit SecE [Desulfurivibrio alkaliphilus]ADH86160.1 preprotein translocase, SecE subunit [Desulfurivibrio alkaliphilus AHT 2]